jgi:hypothetical protein
MLATALAACGQIPALPGPDADLPPWQPSCVVPAPLITLVSSDSPGYGNDCLHGSWNLQSLNGTTTPSSVDQPGHAAIVRPTAIAPGDNPLALDSTFAVHVSGSGQQNVGNTFSYAQLGAPLNTLSTSQIGTVDASAYTGVQFYAKIMTTTGARLRVGNLYTEPAGGMCSTTGGPTGCYDLPAAPLAPSTAWTQYQVPFASLTQAGFGNPSPLGDAFPKSAITVVRWDIDIPATDPAPPWELWVDSVSFY